MLAQLLLLPRKSLCGAYRPIVFGFILPAFCLYDCTGFGHNFYRLTACSTALAINAALLGLPLQTETLTNSYVVQTFNQLQIPIFGSLGACSGMSAT